MSMNSIPAPYAERIERVRAELTRRKIDGLFVQDRMDQFWLTGFTGEDGGVLLTEKAIVLLTDGRFDEAADKQAPFARKVLRKKRTPDVTLREVRRAKIKKLGFDPDVMTVGAFAAHRKEAGAVKLVSTSGVVAGFRETKDATEVKAIRKAVDVAQRAFNTVKDWIRPGVTERAIAARLEYEMQVLGAQGPSFPSIVASGPNASLPHYEPGDRPVRVGEPVLIDWGARLGWYCSDLTRMYWPGEPPTKFAEIYEIARQAHDRAIAAVKPGLTTQAVDRVARQFIEKAGYGKAFSHGLGHGLGLQIHEPPWVRKVKDRVLKPGMVLTVEPGIYLAGVAGVRVEDDVLVTETGHEVLTSLPTALGA
jgi:Xaa-Pro aminopeptidase